MPLKKILLFLLVTPCLLELIFQLKYRLSASEWFFQQGIDHEKIFDPHPLLIGTPRPGAKLEKEGIVISHNPQGFRGAPFEKKKKPGVTRIVTLGGSSTYCVKLSDGQTWPHILGSVLGSPYEVINLGVPGYTTVEHIIQTAFHLSEYQPDIALFYLGWNDARNMHIRRLHPDYSDYHLKQQRYNLGIEKPLWWHRSALIASIRARLGFKGVVPEKLEGAENKMTDKPDPYALALYRRNLVLLSSLCKRLNIRAVFIPHILNYGALMKGTSMFGWLPFVREQDLLTIMGYYNNVMKAVTDQEKMDFVQSVLQEKFVESDFLDGGHFSFAGSNKFAKIVVSHLQATGQKRLLSHQSR